MSLGEQQGRFRQNANAGSRMDGLDSQRKNESPQHVVYGRPAILAACRVWHLQQQGNMRGTGRLLQARLLTDDTKGRSEGDCTSGTLPNRPRVLRCRMHTSRSGMSSGPDQKTTCALWMPLGQRPANGSIYGTTDDGARNIITAPWRVIPEIWKVGHSLVAMISVGKSEQIWHHRQNCTNPHRSAKNGGQVVYASGDRGRIQKTRRAGNNQSLPMPPTGDSCLRCPRRGRKMSR
jgi:hypothetical protein